MFSKYTLVKKRPKKQTKNNNNNLNQQEKISIIEDNLTLKKFQNESLKTIHRNYFNQQV